MTEIRLAEDQMQRLMRCILTINRPEATFPERWRGAERLLCLEPEFDTMPASDLAAKQVLAEREQRDRDVAKPEIYGLTAGEINLREELNAARHQIKRLEEQITCLSLDKATLEMQNETLRAQVPKVRFRVALRHGVGEDSHWAHSIEMDERCTPVFYSRKKLDEWLDRYGWEVVG